MANYRLKLPLIEAVRWDPKASPSTLPQWLLTALPTYRPFGDDGSVIINTVDGEQTAAVGDFIVRGAYGELFPCTPARFLEAYELVE